MMISNGTKSYISVIELMKDEDKFSLLLQDIVNYFNDNFKPVEYVRKYKDIE